MFVEILQRAAQKPFPIRSLFVGSPYRGPLPFPPLYISVLPSEETGVWDVSPGRGEETITNDWLVFIYHHRVHSAIG